MLLAGESCVWRGVLCCRSQMVIFQPLRLKNKFDTMENVYDGEEQLGAMKDWINENM